MGDISGYLRSHATSAKSARPTHPKQPTQRQNMTKWVLNSRGLVGLLVIFRTKFTFLDLLGVFSPMFRHRNNVSTTHPASRSEALRLLGHSGTIPLFGKNMPWMAIACGNETLKPSHDEYIVCGTFGFELIQPFLEDQLIMALHRSKDVVRRPDYLHNIARELKASWFSK